ncbi:hypothetical protein [Fusobacterium gastrosuis]|nr:hypothetical protein [Fusobacterium gastrosuis]
MECSKVHDVNNDNDTSKVEAGPSGIGAGVRFPCSLSESTC